MMLEGSARIWFKILPENFVTSWADLKEKFIKNFQGTCKRATTIVDLEHCVQKEGESTLSWARRASDIIHSSDTITAQTAVIVLERNCKFEPFVHKLGRLKRTVKDMGELMNAVIKYAESEKTKDDDSEEDKAGPSKNNDGKGSQSQQNKHRHDQNTSDLVANTNVGYQRQKQGGSNYHKSEGGGFCPNSFEAAMQVPYPSYSKPGRPANHTWEQCNSMKGYARRE